MATVVAGAILVVGCRAPVSGLHAISALPFPVDTLRSAKVRDGVLHRFIYSAQGPWAINVLEARRDECWSLAALKSQGGQSGESLHRLSRNVRPSATRLPAP